MKMAPYLLPFVMLLLIFSSCEEQVPNPYNGTKIHDNTVITNDATDEQLKKVDSLQLVYKGESEQLNNLQKGDILVSGITNNAPYGYLRKVKKIERINGKILIETSFASLTEAIKECDVSKTVALKPPDTGFGKKNEQFDLTKKTLAYDEDGDTNTTQDQVSVSINYDFEPELKFDLIIKPLKKQKVRKAAFSYITEQDLTLAIDANVSNLTLNHSEQILNKSLPPVTILIGKFPIIVTPRLILTVGAEGEVSASIKTSLNTNIRTEFGASYQSGNWQPISEVTKTFQDPPLQVDAAASVKPYIKPKAEFSLYRFRPVNFNVYAEGYLQARGQCGANQQDLDCNFELNAGVGCYAGLDVGLTLDDKIIDYEQQIFERSWTLIESDPDGLKYFNIANLNNTMTGVDDCNFYEDGQYINGSSHDITFNYDNKLNDSVPVYIRHVAKAKKNDSVLSTDIDTFYSATNSSFKIDQKNNQVTFNACTHFGDGEKTINTFVLFNDNFISNSLVYEIERPQGAPITTPENQGPAAIGLSDS